MYSDRSIEEIIFIAIFFLKDLIYFVIFAIAFYFLPLLIALSRKKRNKPTILLANLFTAWTGIGWVVCFIWAWLKDDAEPIVSQDIEKPQ